MASVGMLTHDRILLGNMVSEAEPICVRTVIIDQIESPLPNLNFQMVGGRNENGHGQQYGFPVAVLGRDVQRSVHLHTLCSYSDIARDAGGMLRK